MQLIEKIFTLPTFETADSSDTVAANFVVSFVGDREGEGGRMSYLAMREDRATRSD